MRASALPDQACGAHQSPWLKAPIFQQTAAYGHFGRPEFSWEKTDKVSEVKAHLGL